MFPVRTVARGRTFVAITVVIAGALIANAPVSLVGAAPQLSSLRTFQPTDLFDLQRIGTITWSPDARYATIEITRRGRTLDGIPNYDLLLLDVAAGKTRPLTPARSPHLGFFNASWSPDGRRLAFLSVDDAAVVRLWLWNVAAAAPTVVAATDLRVAPGDPPLAWIDANRLAIVQWASTDDKYGQLANSILRGKRAADLRARARAGDRSSATVLESRGAPAPRHPAARLEVLDVRTRSRMPAASRSRDTTRRCRSRPTSSARTQRAARTPGSRRSTGERCRRRSTHAPARP
jgi:dipeptidyl aminopeptidase/acylaminoacyl peptidase